MNYTIRYTVLPNVLSQSAAKLVCDVISKMAANADIDSDIVFSMQNPWSKDSWHLIIIYIKDPV